VACVALSPVLKYSNYKFFPRFTSTLNGWYFPRDLFVKGGGATEKYINFIKVQEHLRILFKL